MTKITAFVTLVFTTTLLLLSSSSTTNTVDAVPFADPNIPAFSVYPEADNLGRSKFLSKYGCQNHGLTAVGSVHYHSGPKAKLTFYSGKKCTGKVTHVMTSATVKRMGGPYASQSVLISK
ncbi:hypothetical protein BGZ94_004655 [Podila epigama]|nr:hypothetical protein BGZ94_004655 [Podila epigama]